MLLLVSYISTEVCQASYRSENWIFQCVLEYHLIFNIIWFYNFQLNDNAKKWQTQIKKEFRALPLIKGQKKKISEVLKIFSFVMLSVIENGGIVYRKNTMSNYIVAVSSWRRHFLAWVYRCLGLYTGIFCLSVNLKRYDWKGSNLLYNTRTSGW